LGIGIRRLEAFYNNPPGAIRLPSVTRRISDLLNLTAIDGNGKSELSRNPRLLRGGSPACGLHVMLAF
jgi:hypothetical protein